MKSLKELCIKKTCERINRLSLFVFSSPLPWSLTMEIIRNYSMYKWKEINRDIWNEENNIDLIDFEYISETSPILRSALLSTDNFELVASSDYYCVWTHYYEIDNFNIKLCDGCFRIFKEILKEKNVQFSYTFQHFHESFRASNLDVLYHRRSSWCQNSFNSLLFELKDKYDCDQELHGREMKKVKFCD